MRASIRDFVDRMIGAVPLLGPVVEIGSRQVQPPALSDMRQFFPGLSYTGIDIEDGPGVDMVVEGCRYEDVVPVGSAGTVLCLETIEHMERLFVAIGNMSRLLQSGGHLLLSGCMYFPVHGEPDYWRFTPSGFARLLAEVGDHMFAWAGPKAMPHTLVGIARAGINFSEDEKKALRQALAGWTGRHLHNRG
jgi:hypothetical protein